MAPTKGRKKDPSDGGNNKKPSKDASSPPPSKKSKSSDTSGGFEEFLGAISEQRFNTAESVSDIKFDKTRCKTITERENFPVKHEGVLYWMSRDQRVQGWIDLMIKHSKLVFVLYPYRSACNV